MKANKKILTLGALSLLPISILPLAVISCSSGKITYFESESFKISSRGEIEGFYKEDFKHFGPLTIKEKYKDVTIKYISTLAFRNQTNITSITLPKTLVEIGRFAFQNIESPVSVPSGHDFEIPLDWDLSHLTNLEIIDNRAFGASGVLGKPKLALNLSGANKLREIREGAFIGRGISSLSFPETITTIGKYAFSHNQLTSLTIPKLITNIENNAFSFNDLNFLTIPNSITTIGEGAFENNQLMSLNLPNSITTIGKGAFDDNQLTSLTLPDSVTTIGDNAFSNNAFTPASKIVLPSQFDTPTERKRIGLPPKTPASAPLETDFVPLTIENRVKGKLK